VWAPPRHTRLCSDADALRPPLSCAVLWLMQKTGCTSKGWPAYPPAPVSPPTSPWTSAHSSLRPPPPPSPSQALLWTLPTQSQLCARTLRAHVPFQLRPPAVRRTACRTPHGPGLPCPGMMPLPPPLACIPLPPAPGPSYYNPYLPYSAHSARWAGPRGSACLPCPSLRIPQGRPSDTASGQTEVSAPKPELMFLFGSHFFV